MPRPSCGGGVAIPITDNGANSTASIGRTMTCRTMTLSYGGRITPRFNAVKPDIRVMQASEHPN